MLADHISADRAELQRLQATQGIDFIDSTTERDEQAKPGGDASDGDQRWAYYPWRKAAVRIPGPNALHAARRDRNRHLITSSEQQRLQTLRIGVVGLSSGHAVAYCSAAQRLCGALRFADGDTLELSNVNRVRCSAADTTTRT